MKATEINTNKPISINKLNFLYETVQREMRSFAIRLTKLDEAVTLPIEGDLEQQLSELNKRFEAARRGLGLVNRLPAGPDKAKHARRVMQNLNFIRMTLARTIKAMHSFENASNEHENSFAENEEETSTPWEGNTLGSLMKTNLGNGICPYCDCDPCECDHNSSTCPACGGSSDSKSKQPNINITIVMPSQNKSENEDDVCPECGFDPCECDMDSEEDGEICPECGFDPCECEFSDNDEDVELQDEEEEEECPECDAYEQSY